MNAREKLICKVENGNGWLALDKMALIYSEEEDAEIEVKAIALVQEYIDNGKPVVTLRAVDANYCSWDIDDYFTEKDIEFILTCVE